MSASISNFEKFFGQDLCPAPGYACVMVVVDTSALIKYHRELDWFLNQRKRSDLHFRFPFVIHQELDHLKKSGSSVDKNSVKCAAMLLDKLMDFSWGSDSIVEFQNCNEAAQCSSSNFPHCTNDDAILLAALQICNLDQESKQKTVLVWTMDEILSSKCRAAGLGAIFSTQTNPDVLVLKPPAGANWSWFNQKEPSFGIVTPSSPELSRRDFISQSDHGLKVEKGNLLGNNMQSMRSVAGSTMLTPKPEPMMSDWDCDSARVGPPHSAGFHLTPSVDSQWSISQQGAGDGAQSQFGMLPPAVIPSPQQLARKKFNIVMPKAVVERTQTDYSSTSSMEDVECLDKTSRRSSESGRGSPMISRPLGLETEVFARSGTSNGFSTSVHRPMSAAPSSVEQWEPPPQRRPSAGGRAAVSQLNSGSISCQPSQDWLSRFLVGIVTSEMPEAFGAAAWTDICFLGRPPNNWQEAIAIIEKHWVAAFKFVFGTSRAAKDSSTALLAMSTRMPTGADLNKAYTHGRTLANAIMATNYRSNHCVLANQYLRVCN